MEILLRFLIGGVVVSLFSLVGGLFKPASFGGLFGAAPSVALATIGLSISREGQVYASLECRSMMAGAAAFVVYALLAIQLLMRFRMPALAATLISTIVWFFVAFVLWQVVL